MIHGLIRRGDGDAVRVARHGCPAAAKQREGGQDRGVPTYICSTTPPASRTIMVDILDRIGRNLRETLNL